MSDVELIIRKVRSFNRKQATAVQRAINAHLEELEEIAAYDAVKSKKERTTPLATVLRRYAKAEKR